MYREIKALKKAIGKTRRIKKGYSLQRLNSVLREITTTCGYNFKPYSGGQSTISRYTTKLRNKYPNFIFDYQNGKIYYTINAYTSRKWSRILTKEIKKVWNACEEDPVKPYSIEDFEETEWGFCCRVTGWIGYSSRIRRGEKSFWMAGSHDYGINSISYKSKKRANSALAKQIRALIVKKLKGEN